MNISSGGRSTGIERGDLSIRGYELSELGRLYSRHRFLLVSSRPAIEGKGERSA